MLTGTRVRAVLLGAFLFVMLFSTSVSYAESLGIVSVSGQAFLDGAVDHSGIRVVFEAVSLSAVTDSAFTDSNGDFSTFLQVGIYNVTYTKEPGYLPYPVLEDQFFASDTVLPGVTLEPGTPWYLSGDLSGRLIDTYTYFVDGPLFVQAPDTLIIDPGVSIRFRGNYSLAVHGLLLAQGVEGDSISFTSYRFYPAPGDWSGISFLDNTANNSVLAYTHISFARTGVYFGNSSNTSVQHCLIDHNGLGVDANLFSFPPITGSPTITECVVEHNEGTGIHWRAASPITQCAIRHNGGDGITVNPTFLNEITTITGCTVEFNGRSGIAAYGRSTISDCKIQGNESYGVDIAFSSVSMTRCLVEGNVGGILINVGSPTVAQCTIQNNSGYGVYSSGNTVLSSNIIRAHAFGIGVFSGTLEIHHNDIFENGTNFSGTGLPSQIGQVVTTNANGDSCDTYLNIFLDPRQVDPGNGDYTLLSVSPCIDAGDPALPLDPDTTIADIGAYYYGQVIVDPPLAEFSANPLSGTGPLTVAFTNLSTGVITSYSWNFGDGRTSSLRDQVHTYADPDTYTVSLTVIGPGGTDIETKVDYIDVRRRPNPPVVDFVGQPTSGYAPLAVTFIDLTTGSVDSVRWYFGDGGTSTDRDTLTHEYQNPGTYTVRLVAYGEDGTDEKIRTDYITVNPVPDILAEFYALPRTGVAPLSVTFTDQSFGLIDEWAWQFGDGDSSAVENPIHTYTSAGVYTVTLTVEGQSGTDTEVKTDYIVVLQDAPTILSMVDVPSDQGGWLYLTFARAGFDYVGEEAYPVANYFVFRRVDDPMLLQAVHEQGKRLNDGDQFTLQTNEATITAPVSRLGGQVLRYAERYFVTGNLTSGTWAVVAGVPAHQQDDYIALVPTVADSTPNALIYSVYMVSAETTTPSVYFFSAPDSGYSIDNLAPAMPQNLTGGHDYEPLPLALDWDPNTEHDLAGYNVYQGVGEDFEPGEEIFKISTTESSVTRIPYSTTHYIKVSAVDIHGNESELAVLPPEDITVPTLVTDFSSQWTGTAVEVRWTLSGDAAELDFLVKRKTGTGGVYIEIQGDIARSRNSYAFTDRSAEPGKTYVYRVSITEKGTTLGTFESMVSIPNMAFALYQNVPNPFNPTTTISYDVPAGGSEVALHIYDVSGRLVRTLVSGHQTSGHETVTWDARDDQGEKVATGIYFYRLRGTGFEKTLKMTLLQ